MRNDRRDLCASLANGRTVVADQSSLGSQKSLSTETMNEESGACANRSARDSCDSQPDDLVFGLAAPALRRSRNNSDLDSISVGSSVFSTQVSTVFRSFLLVCFFPAM